MAASAVRTPCVLGGRDVLRVWTRSICWEVAIAFLVRIALSGIRGGNGVRNTSYSVALRWSPWRLRHRGGCVTVVVASPWWLRHRECTCPPQNATLFV
jgi:hypothetical protein